LHRALWNLCIVHSPTNALLLNLEKFKTLHENTHKYHSYIFRSSTILRELVQNLANVIFLLKHSLNYVVVYYVEMWQHVMERRACCLLCVPWYAATSTHNILRRNFNECFNRNITLARLCTSSLRMVEDRNM